MATPYRQRLKPGETFFGGGRGVIIWNVVPAKPKPQPDPTVEKKRKK